MCLLILIRPSTPPNFVRVPDLENLNGGTGVLGGCPVLTRNPRNSRSSPAGGNSIEFSVITHAPEDVSIFVEDFHGQLRQNVEDTMP